MVMYRCVSGILVGLTLVVFEENAAKYEVWKPPVENPVAGLCLTHPAVELAWIAPYGACAIAAHVAHREWEPPQRTEFEPESGGKEVYSRGGSCARFMPYERRHERGKP